MNLRSTIYSTAMRHGTEKEFNQLVDIYKRAELQEEKVRILRALGASDKKDLIKKALEFALSEEVRDQDVFYVISSCKESIVGRYLTWEWFKENFEKLNATFGTGQFLMARIVSLSTLCLVTLRESITQHTVEFCHRFQSCPSAYTFIMFTNFSCSFVLQAAWSYQRLQMLSHRSWLPCTKYT